MYEIIKRVSDGATFPGTVKHLNVTRLTPEVYADLLKKCPAIMVTAETSAMQAGFQLGVQHILKLLREGYLTEAPPA